MDMPLEGYLRSRRSERKPLFDPEYLVNFLPGPDVFVYLADRMRDRCITRQLGEEEKGRVYRFMLWLFSKAMRQELDEWEDSLTKSLQSNAGDLVTTWPNVDLFVPLIVDYEYWFKNTIDVSIRDQVNAMVDQVVLPQRGRFHPFTPFDPGRELVWRKSMNNPDGQQEKTSPLELVKDAIQNKGFIGVKVYNSLGYKPLNNADPITELRRKRIAIRNEKMPYCFEGKEYDAVLRELYAYCVKNEAPITAHCTIGGIEAYPDASYHFCAASFWRDVLSEYPDLRLNLAHFGCNFERHEGYLGKSWMKEVCDMIVEFPHVYADVSQHEVTISKLFPLFVSDYKAIERDYASHFEKLKKRILYGSDWHVLRRVKNDRAFMERFREVFRKSDFYHENELGDFFGRNALEFLGLLPGGKNRDRLSRFYKKQHIPQPEWFRKVAVG